MEMIHITDVISVLGLPYPSHSQTSYNVKCPCCDTEPHKAHLNINLKKEVFRCPRCGVSGGIFDLYALFRDIPRDKVYKALTEELGMGTKYEKPKVKRQSAPVIEACDCPIIDIESRNATYSALLAKLSLANDHKANLLGRGLSEADIERLEYKTTPVVGMTTIAKQLQSDGLYLAGVPGFYRTESGVWTFVSEKRGILIPVRNTDGLIQGLQIRRDNVEKRKFRWFSSTDMKDGCKAEGWAHLVGKITPEVVLTEGPMKADVVNALSGKTVLAVPGVNSLTHLKLTLEKLKEQGVVKIQTAFDMDFCTNIHVQNGFNNLLLLLDEMGFRFGTYVWDPRYKGLDDFILAKKINKNTERSPSKTSLYHLEVKMKENKKDRFKRLAEARVNKIISMLKLLGNCSFTGNYEYTEEQVKTIFDTLHTELERASKRFKCELKGTGKFSLSDDICEEEFPSVTLQLPDGSRLRASAVDDKNFPAVNIWLQTEKNIKEQLICFVEYNEERDNGKELCIGICSPGSEDPAYYKSFDNIKKEEGGH